MRISTTSKTNERLASAWAAALAIALFAVPVVAADLGPQQIIRSTADEVLAILRDSESGSADRRTKLEEIAGERFDFKTMARLVLAKDWKRLEDAQKEEFVAEFTRYLANDYGSRIDRYQQEKVEVMGESPRPRGDVVVKTKIVGGENNGALVDYRMRNRDGEWRIIDVVIEGISLVANFRDQFREVLGKDGADRLLEKLREKNAS